MEATIELPGVVVKQTDSLEKIVFEVATADIPFVIQRLSASLIKEQIDLGNPPTNILVDNSGKRPIDTAKKRVQAFFTDKDAIRLAVYDAWERVIALTRQRTGRAVGTYELWFNDRRIGHSPTLVDAYLDRMIPGKDFFRIVGPVIVYGRKLYWNPKGKPKFRKTAINKRIRINGMQVKLVRIRGIMDQVEQQMRRKHRSVIVAEDWVTTTALPKDGRTPGLYIGFRKRGSTLPGVS